MTVCVVGDHICYAAESFVHRVCALCGMHLQAMVQSVSGVGGCDICAYILTSSVQAVHAKAYIAEPVRGAQCRIPHSRNTMMSTSAAYGGFVQVRQEAIRWHAVCVITDPAIAHQTPFAQVLGVFLMTFRHLPRCTRLYTSALARFFLFGYCHILWLRMFGLAVSG